MIARFRPSDTSHEHDASSRLRPSLRLPPGQPSSSPDRTGPSRPSAYHSHPRHCRAAAKSEADRRFRSHPGLLRNAHKNGRAAPSPYAGGCAGAPGPCGRVRSALPSTAIECSPLMSGRKRRPEQHSRRRFCSGRASATPPRVSAQAAIIPDVKRLAGARGARERRYRRGRDASRVYHRRGRGRQSAAARQTSVPDSMTPAIEPASRDASRSPQRSEALSHGEVRMLERVPEERHRQASESRPARPSAPAGAGGGA